MIPNQYHYCTRCQKAHGNPVIDLFNEFLKYTTAGNAPPPAIEMDLYRAYIAGQHDSMALVMKASEWPDAHAERVVNQIAIAIRDATLAGIPDEAADLKAQVHESITERFFIREEDGCHGN